MQLSIRGVSHFYDGLHALDGVDLDVADGETCVLIGPSGCGKSPLLSIMGGLLRPATGAVETAGPAPDGCLNPLTYVFQDFALLPWRTVAGNILLALEHHRLGAAEARRRVDEVLALTGLEDFADAFPKQLSGGMRQRVGIARAVVVRPAVMLMDEPLSALDAQTRELLTGELIAIWRHQRTTTVYVTHNLHEAVRLGDRIAVMSRRPGRLRRVVDVPVPREDRVKPSSAAALAALQDELWGLIRDEAAMADREVARV